MLSLGTNQDTKLISIANNNSATLVIHFTTLFDRGIIHYNGALFNIK